jgi:ATP-binding cassette subfamily B protein
MTLAATGAAVFGLYQLSSRLRTMHFSAASLYESTLFVRDYTSFLGLARAPKTGGRNAPDILERIEIDGVTFGYPDTARAALDDVSIEIGAGEIVALVGENGSGKTTLAKLIAGLYEPERGRILWNGRDAAEIDPDELRSKVAVIFQDFERYMLTAGENIGVGRHELIGDAAAIAAAAERAGAQGFIGRLPAGYDTMLGREFLGGWDLSIGQWQRLALARAFFRDAALVILDEPTAALDARAESALFARMRELLEGRAAVLISHRFSSVRSADRIYVLHRGRVAEAGTHEELMALDGIYAELFTLQAAQYLTGSSVTRSGG